MSKNKFLFLVICTFAHLHICTSLPAQNRKIDSLQRLLKFAIQDTNKIKLLMALAKEMDDTIKQPAYLSAAIKLSREIHATRFEATVETAFGYYYMFGNINYTKATACYTRAIKIYKDANEPSGVATCYHQFGVISMAFNDFRTAADYFRKAIVLNEKYKNEKLLRMNYNMMGSSFMKRNQFDSALFYYKKSEAIAVKGKLPTHVLYVNMASCYLQMGNIDSSWKYIHLTDSSYKARSSKYGVHWVNMLSGHAELLSKNYLRAIKYLEEPVKYALEKNDEELFINSAPNLVLAYKQVENYKEAYLLQEKLSKMNDSLSGVDKAASVRAIEQKYEQGEKEKIDQLTQEKKEAEHRAEVNRQKVIIWVSTISFVFALCFGIFIFRGYRQKLKVNEIISKQKTIVEEKQKEILDSIHYAKRIQKSMLPTEKYIVKNINRLQNKS